MAKLQMEDLVVGTGPEAKKGQTVSVHYTGWLTDGKKFDSSKDHGKPFSFALGRGQVIQGWDEGIKLFKKGGKGTLYVPGFLAYGRNPRPGSPFRPFEALTFDIEILDIKPPMTH